MTTQQNPTPEEIGERIASIAGGCTSTHYGHTPKDQCYCPSCRQVREIAAAVRNAEERGKVIALPEGHVAVREGGKVVVRKVLGTLPVTADGVVVEKGADVFHPGEPGVLEVMRGLHDWRDTVKALNESGHATKDDSDLPEWIGYRSYYEHDTGYSEEAAYPLSLCYSTREAAEAAAKSMQEPTP